MTIPENLLLMVAGVGVLQAILLSNILVFHPRGEKSVNIFLAAYIICLSLPMIAPIVIYVLSWHYVSFIEPLTLLIGPTLYLYVSSFKETVTFRKAWPHFILYIAAMIVASYMFVQVKSKFPDTNYPPEEVIYGPVMFIRSLVRLAQLTFYYFLARHTLTTYQRSIHQLYSNTSRINLSWMRWLINGYLILVLAMIVIFGLILRYPEHFRWFLLINTSIVSPYIYIISYKGLTQPTLWQLHREISKEKVQEELKEAEAIIIPSTTQVTVEKQAQKDDRNTAIIQKTIRLMEEEKLYQETELNLQQLADRLDVPAYVVSQAINEGLRKSFYDLVNGYRVEEAKRLLVQPGNRQYKVLSIGFEAGFNSKTTFNTVFKKFTGQSPTEFREHNTQQSPHL